MTIKEAMSQEMARVWSEGHAATADERRCFLEGHAAGMEDFRGVVLATLDRNRREAIALADSHGGKDTEAGRRHLASAGMALVLAITVNDLGNQEYDDARAHLAADLLARGEL